MAGIVASTQTDFKTYEYDYAGYICFWKRAPNQTRERIGCGLKTFHGISVYNTGNYANWTGLRELRVKNCTQMQCVDTMHCLDGLNPNGINM